MELNRTRSGPEYTRLILAVLLVVCGSLFTPAQDVGSSAAPDNPPEANLSRSLFRTETIRVAGGAELVTVFARDEGPDGDLPLVSVLRDTLGDVRDDNDRLRYVWLHSFTRASLAQKAASAVPFLYTRVSNNDKIGNSPPPALMDLNRPSGSNGWDTVFWQVFKHVVIADAANAVKATALQFRQNRVDNRRTAIATALAVLSIYQDTASESVLSDQELRDIQAKLSLDGKLLGAHMQTENLERVFNKELERTRDERAQNWELLRQMSERQGLFFQPLKMPDGTARHAIVWIAEEDLAENHGRKFDGRFLNIKDPWSDKSLREWKGYKETRWYDADDREVDEGTEGAKPRTLIPLAVYGLDYPKIPAILVDFRNNLNPKTREMSRRVLTDVLNNVLSIGQFGSLPLFVGRYAYDFVTSHRGMDFNQASRLKSYAELKLLLKLDESLSGDFKPEIAKRVEKVSLNPLENDTAAEEMIARRQYKNLIAYARDENGLAVKLRNDRREEMVRLSHSLPARVAFSLGHFVTFGAYTHREKETPQLWARMEAKRRLDYHERIVREIAFETVDPEIDSDIDKLKVSLAFLSENGADAMGKTAKALAKIFSVSADDDIRSLCLAGLYKVNSVTAKRELLAIYENNGNNDHWRDSSARYLKLALLEGQRISKRDAQTVAGISAIN
ncbi:MAG TPA: hypothetical protein VL501_07585 [Pyrinomonadaceae bacterium]|nr:hypothetical protein [Pyrinomonadaceae bacterium]